MILILSTPIESAASSSRRKYFWLFLTLVLGLSLDQGSKYLLSRALAPGQVVEVIPDYFNLVHVYNRGAAFGLLSSLTPSAAQYFFVLSTLLALIFLLYLHWRTPTSQPLFLWGYQLLLTGAAGNLIDRIRLGEVLDFLDFYVGRYHWPAFNVADSLITIGAGLLILALWRADGAN